MIKACIVGESDERINFVFGHGRRERFAEKVDLFPQIIKRANLEEHSDFLADVCVIICTWDMTALTTEELEKFFPKLEIVFYAAGSVQYFARPMLERGVRIVSAWGAMCQPVAEFTAAMIFLLNKGAFLSARAYKEESFQQGKAVATANFPGTYGTSVGILGAGMIGARTIEIIKDSKADVELMVFDPFISDERKKKLGIERTYSLEEIFSQCQTISNHIANNERTQGIFNYRLFSMMKKNAAFINTGRGAQVVEPDLVRALKEEPSRYAVLDVTWPEPMEADNPLLGMPNVLCFPHIAGYASLEVLRMADYMYEQMLNYLENKHVEYEVNINMLESMA